MVRAMITLGVFILAISLEAFFMCRVQSKSTNLGRDTLFRAADSFQVSNKLVNVYQKNIIDNMRNGRNTYLTQQLLQLRIDFFSMGTKELSKILQ